MQLRVTGAEIGPDECIAEVEIFQQNTHIARVMGERNAKVFVEAYEMFDILKKVISDSLTADDYSDIEKIIARIENSPALDYNGLTMQEMFECVVLGK